MPEAPGTVAPCCGLVLGAGGSCPWDGGLCHPGIPVTPGRDRSASSALVCNEQRHQRRQGREARHETPGPCKPQAMSSFSPPRGVLIKRVSPEPNQLSEPHQLAVCRAEPGKSCTRPQPITAKPRAVQTKTTKETWWQRSNRSEPRGRGAERAVLPGSFRSPCSAAAPCAPCLASARPGCLVALPFRASLFWCEDPLNGLWLLCFAFFCHQKQRHGLTGCAGTAGWRWPRPAAGGSDRWAVGSGWGAPGERGGGVGGRPTQRPAADTGRTMAWAARGRHRSGASGAALCCSSGEQITEQTPTGALLTSPFLPQTTPSHPPRTPNAPHGAVGSPCARRAARGAGAGWPPG